MYDKVQLGRMREQRRRLVAPTCAELLDEEGAIAYCLKRGLSRTASERVIRLVVGTVGTIDWRDHRRVPKADRVPRSLENQHLSTPPRYWDISDPVPPPMLEEIQVRRKRPIGQRPDGVPSCNAIDSKPTILHQSDGLDTTTPAVCSC